MSLLLDALKKAADDKEKKSKEDLTSHEKNKSPGTDVELPQEEELSLQSNSDSDNSVEVKSVVGANELEEFSLDDLEYVQDDVLQSESLGADGQQDEDIASDEKEKHREKRSDTDKFVISDDALSMLIYKTNHNVKQSKRIIFSTILLISLAILVSGGVYSYMDMESEIEALERKHQIAMQSMRSKTNNEKTPDKSEIIRNLVSDAELEEKVKYAKKHMADDRSQVRTKPVVQPTKSNQVKIKSAVAELSIERTNKSDPVGEKLNDAWLAYEDADYAEAKQSYKDVLVLEKNNRDALLGLGAIAVIEKDRATAREVYLSLLDLDPRDPVATSALASLHNDESSLAADKEHLHSILKKNPDAPHLNFALGNVYAKLNKWTAAQQYYFNAWQHDNKNADYVFNLAVSMDQLNKQKQAIDFYKDSLVKASDKQVSFSREAVQKRIAELTRL